MSATRTQRVWAVIRLGSDKWPGPVEAGEGGEVVVDLPPHASLAHAPVGSLVSVGLAATSLDDAIREPGMLVGVDLRTRGVRCTLRLDNWQQIRRRLPPLPRPEAERRQSIRVSATDDLPVEVPVRLPDGPPSARHMVGRVRDVGGGGLGLWFPRGAEKRLCAVKEFAVRVEWPGFPGERDWRCQVRNRRLDGHGVRYGVQFLTEGGSEADGPSYEPLWDCLFCGAEGLLGETHAFCPACGFERGDAATRLPDWDDLVTHEAHPFTGTELTCSACGVTHAGAAVFCAHCGHRL